MPKYRGDWGAAVDPESEEYNPTLQDLADERLLQEEIGQELEYLDDLIRKPGKDPFSGDPDRARSPKEIWSALLNLKNKVRSLTDKKDRERVLVEIKGFEKAAIKLAIPFLAEQVNNFGWFVAEFEDPEKVLKARRKVLETEKEMRKLIEESKDFNAQERAAWLRDLGREKERFESYEREPLLYRERNIQIEILRELDGNWYGDKAKQKSIEDKIEILKTLAGQMRSPEDRRVCLVQIGWAENRLRDGREAYEKAKRETHWVGGRERGGRWAFEVLGVGPDASLDTVKKAYKRLISQKHPDRFASQSKEAQKSAGEETRRIIEAFSFLEKFYAGGKN